MSLLRLSVLTQVLCTTLFFSPVPSSSLFSSSSSSSTFTASSVVTSPSWTNLYPDTNTSSTLARREGAMITSGPTAGSVLVFGGCSSSCCYAPLNDLWLWQSSSSLSTSLSTNGQWNNLTEFYQNSNNPFPTGRLYHTGTLGASPNLIYMYGGADELIGARSDFWTLEILTNTSKITTTNLKDHVTVSNIVWTQLAATAPPGSRAAHSQLRIANDGSFVLYGGENETDTLNDLWLYNCTSQSWSLLNDGTGSNSPGGRSLAALTLVKDPSTQQPYLILMGGTDFLGNDHADVWAYDMEKNTWIVLGNANGGGNTTDPWPLERHGHAIWSTTNTGSVTNTVNSPLFYLFGGQHGGAETDPFVGDVWLYSTQQITSNGSVNGTFTQLQSSKYQPNPNQPVARGMGGIALYPDGTNTNNNVLYFGGFSGYDGGLADLLHNDVWVFSSSG